MAKSALGDFLGYLPFTVRQKVSGLGGFVEDVLAKRLGGHKNRIEKVPKETLDEIKYLVACFALLKFLRSSAMQVQTTLEIYKELGVKSFSIGNVKFSKSSEAAKLPKKLENQFGRFLKKNIPEVNFFEERSIRSFVLEIYAAKVKK